MLNLLKNLSGSLLDLLYPPLCLHCDDSLDKYHPLFCAECIKYLTLIDPNERCPYCFSFAIDAEYDKCCDFCRENPSLIERTASAFDYAGPAATLIKKCKYGGQFYLAEGLGAYMTAQFLQLNWPMPDCIVPMPMARLRRIERGYNQSLLIAKSIAKLLDRPIYDILKRRSGDFSQAGLNHHQRLNLDSEVFSIKKGAACDGLCVLLVDDVLTTGSSLRCCAEALVELNPKHIYALTACRAI